MNALDKVEGTPSFVRRIAAAVVVAVGVVFIVSTFANNLFTVGPDFEEMMEDFGPLLAEPSITSARGDLAMLGGVGDEFATAIVPALSQQLGMSPEEFMGFTAESFPDVANGVQALPQIVPEFNGLIDTLDSQRDLFASADAIPTESLPATTVPWGLFFAGLALIVAGVMLYRSGSLGLALTGGLGVLIVIVTLLLTLIPKAADADDLNGNLESFYTAETVEGAKGALATVSAMGTQMQAEMLPALGQQLGMSGDQLNGFLEENFPATAQALGVLPHALGRFSGLVETFDANLDNYDTIKPVAFSPIIWTLFLGGLVTLLAAGVALWADRRKMGRVAASQLEPTRPKEPVNA
jgi:hypothetical protein